MGVEGQSLRKLREFCVLETSNSAFQRQFLGIKHFNGFSVNKNTDRPKSAAAMAAAVPTALPQEVYPMFKWSYLIQEFCILLVVKLSQ